jgi:hypothetical protein
VQTAAAQREIDRLEQRVRVINHAYGEGLLREPPEPGTRCAGWAAGSMASRWPTTRTRSPRELSIPDRYLVSGRQHRSFIASPTFRLKVGAKPTWPACGGKDRRVQRCGGALASRRRPCA